MPQDAPGDNMSATGVVTFPSPRNPRGATERLRTLSPCFTMNSCGKGD
jgi:hypothetical protein